MDFDLSPNDPQLASGNKSINTLYLPDKLCIQYTLSPSFPHRDTIPRSISKSTVKMWDTYRLANLSVDTPPLPFYRKLENRIYRKLMRSYNSPLPPSPYFKRGSRNNRIAARIHFYKYKYARARTHTRTRATILCIK